MVIGFVNFFNGFDSVWNMLVLFFVVCIGIGCGYRGG